MEKIDEVIPIRRQLTVGDYQLMNLRRGYWDARYADIPELPHKEVVKKYLQKFDEMVKQGYGLWLYGPSGTGKTSIAAVALKEARRRMYKCFFGNALELLDAFENDIPFEDGKTVMQRCMEVDFLVIDDFGRETELFAGRERTIWERIMRERAANIKTTWITMNMDFDGIKKRYGDGSPLISVLMSCTMPVEVSGKDLRLEKGRTLQKELME